jgi:lipoprotein LpqB-like beta-propeller protein
VGDLRGRLTGLAGALVAAGVLAGGCTAIPSGGGTLASAPARPALAGSEGGCCGLIVRGPQPEWDAQQIVNGFLLASAKPAHDFALARQYLAPSIRGSWKPGSGVTIIAQPPEVSRLRIAQPGATTVRVSGQEIATLQGDQYAPAASGDQAAPAQQFTLAQVDGQTLISQLPPANGLLLTDNLFHLVYTARDLYYYGLRSSSLVPSSSSLVPSPVWVPDNASLAKTLASDLLRNPPGDLRAALSTNISGARISSVESAPGKTAIVNLHLSAGTSATAYPAMARQLVATLTSSGYGPRLFEAVELKINGRLWAPSPGRPVQTLATAGLDAPHRIGAGSVYYVDPDGGIRMVNSLSPSGRPLPSAGPARVPVRDVAVSPDGKYLAAIGEHGDGIYTASLQGATAPGGRPSAGQFHLQLGDGTHLTSLSWDNGDDLWVTGRVDHSPGVWVLHDGRGSPIRAKPPKGLGQVTAIRIAPDGTRAAMVVASQDTPAHIELGYIANIGPVISITHVLPLGPGLFNVSAIAWFDEDHLVAAAQQGTSAAQLWEVPANGDGATALPYPQRGVTSITAAGPQSPLYLTENGQLLTSVALGQPWTRVTQGQAADYPG